MRPATAHPVIASVRSALGRAAPLTSRPVPPAIPEPIARLVHSDIGLPGLFAKRAAENKMDVEAVRVDNLAERLLAYLQTRGIASAAVPISPFLERIGVLDVLHRSGFHLSRWDQITTDQLFDYDCGITDVYAAVAETGSVVIKSSATHGRALSLVPPIHIAIVEPKNLVPDLVDLFDKLTADGTGPGVAIISGPSKTADIEMNLVQGVHGPGTVKIFLLD